MRTPHSSGPEPTVDVLRSSAALAALRPEWEALWRVCPDATPFHSPVWLLPWWRHFGCGTLLVLTLRRGDHLIGLMPLYIRPDHDGRKLMPLGVGISDYLDGLFHPDTTPLDVSALIARLGAYSDLWDCCELPHLRAGSLLIEAAAPRGWSDECLRGGVCPQLALPISRDGLEQMLPKRLSSNVRYSERRANRSGALDYLAASANELPLLLDSLVALHTARWRSRGLPGMLADRAVRAFHHEAAPALLAAGTLRLYALRIAGELVAIHYGFLHRRHAYYYLSGFVPDQAAISPGTLIVYRAIKEAVREGATMFDFLRGAEDYKYRWGARDAPLYLRRLHAGR